MMLTFPEYAIKCIHKLEAMGFEAYLVGGCVRDALLGRNISDIDITTNALPRQIIEIFDNTIPTGIKHGTVTVILEGNPVEITTYRTEKGYNDSRHPDEVIFVSNLEQDLSRRDFTINAMAYNPKKGLIDLFGGKNDLVLKTIKTVGDPKIRFSEDALRILRAFRFASVLDFTIEDKTRQAAMELKSGINNISGERLLSELIKLSCGKKPSAVLDFVNAGGLECFGIYSALYSPAVFDSLCTFDLKNDIVPIFFSLFKCDIELITKKLKPSNDLKNHICFLIIKADKLSITDKTNLKLALNEHGEQNLILYANQLKLLDSPLSDFIFHLYDEVIRNNEPFRLKDLPIDGKDIMDFGFSGTEVGAILQKLLLHVISHPKDNRRNILLEIAKN